METGGACMGHRVSLYTVQVRPKRDKSADFRLLGDIDNNGTSLADVLSTYMDTDFEVVNAENTTSLRCETAIVQGDEVFATFLHGQTGVAADIVNKEGDLRIRQSIDDTQRVRCAALLRLPKAAHTGWLAAHSNNGRAPKGLLEQGIQEKFRDQYPQLILEIRPLVLASVLDAAVAENRIDKVKLRKLERSTDRGAGAGKWVDEGVDAKIELSITPSGRAKRILSALPRRFLEGDKSAFGEIVQFEGMQFDEARVEVTLPGGSRRTFNIEHPGEGHPFTEEIRDQLRMIDGEPTDDSLRAALRRTLSDVGG